MNLPYMQFYCRDWMGEQGLQRLGYAERGLWIEILCLMATGDEYGKLTNGGKPLSTGEIARLTRGDKQEVEQLLKHLLEQKVYSVDENGVIYSRRMVKDHHIRTERAKAGKAGQAALHAQTPKDPISHNPDPISHSLLDDLLKQNFEEAWKSYPSKTGSKEKASQAYRKWRKEGDTQEQILAGIQRYVASVAARRAGGFKDLNYQNGQTFFNGRGWTTEWANDTGPQRPPLYRLKVNGKHCKPGWIPSEHTDTCKPEDYELVPEGERK